MKLNKLIIILLIGTLSLFLIACDEDEKEIEDSISEEKEEVEESHSEKTPKSGGDINFAIQRFDYFNPLLNSNWDLNQAHNLMYEGLLKLDKNGKPEPLLAEEWSIGENFLSVDLKLRDNVKWSDGEDFSAEDIVFTLDLIRFLDTNNNSLYQNSVRHISSVTILDDNNIRLHFTRPFSNALEVLTFPIMPKHILEGNEHLLEDNSFLLPGTGMYRVDNFENGKEINLIKNEYYWGEMPYIENINIFISRNIDIIDAKFENGDTNIHQLNTFERERYLKEGVGIFDYSSNEYEFLGFNFDNQNIFTENKEMRKIINKAIDKNRIVENVYYNLAMPSDLPLRPDHWLVEESELNNEIDSEDLIQEISELGFTMGEEFFVDENGNTLELDIIYNEANLAREITGNIIKENLSNIGIKVNLEPLTNDELNNRLENRNYSAFIGGWKLANIPDFSYLFHSTQRDRTNIIGYNSSEMDELIESIFVASDLEEKINLNKQLQEYILENKPYISILFRKNSIAVSKNIYGELHPTNFNIYNGIENLFIEYTTD